MLVTGAMARPRTTYEDRNCGCLFPTVSWRAHETQTLLHSARACMHHAASASEYEERNASTCTMRRELRPGRQHERLDTYLRILFEASSVVLILVLDAVQRGLQIVEYGEELHDVTLNTYTNKSSFVCRNMKSTSAARD